VSEFPTQDTSYNCSTRSASVKNGLHRTDTALEHFEAGRLRPAARILGNLQIEHQDDGPSLLLLAQVVNALCDPEHFDPAWTLTTK